MRGKCDGTSKHFNLFSFVDPQLATLALQLTGERFVVPADYFKTTRYPPLVTPEVARSLFARRFGDYYIGLFCKYFAAAV